MEAGSSVVQEMSVLSLEEEHDMRVEHALEILKADVSHSLQICLSSPTTACTKKFIISCSVWSFHVLNSVACPCCRLINVVT